MKNSTDNLLLLYKARILVGFLGENARYAWWKTAFYEAFSKPFLEPVFAKTPHLAQYHGVLEAARLVHDEHLNVSCFHLFRLPEEIEQDLHEIAKNDIDKKSISHSLLNQEVAIVALKEIALIANNFREGPIIIGNTNDIKKIDTIKIISGNYFSAFTKNVRTFPYLVSNHD